MPVSPPTFRAARHIAAVLVLAALAALPASPALAASTVKIGASLHVEIDRFTSTCANCGPNGTPMDIPGCNFVAVAQFGNYAGASSYHAVVRDNHPYFAADPDREFTGPPFYDDQEGWKTPRGVHWFGLSGGGGGGDCSDAEAEMRARYKVKRAVATFDGKARIIGSTTEADHRPIAGVEISINGPSKKSARTNRGGAYSEAVKEGRYRVRAPDGFCVVGIRNCTNEKTINVNGVETVDFLRTRKKVRLSGEVQERECLRETCHQVAYRPAARRRVTAIDGSGTSTDATTDSRGEFSLKVPAGRYTLQVAGVPPTEVDPSSRSVDAKKDIPHLDFTICTPPAEYKGEPLGCDLVEIEGRVVDVLGEPYDNASVEGGGDYALTGPQGRFSLLVPRGEVVLNASEEENPLGRTVVVKATKRVNTARIKLLPVMSIVPRNSPQRLFVEVHSLPILRGGRFFELSFELREADPTDEPCSSRGRATFDNGEGRARGPRTSPRSASFITSPSGRRPWCPGIWGAVLSDNHGKVFLRATDFVIRD